MDELLVSSRQRAPAFDMTESEEILLQRWDGLFKPTKAAYFRRAALLSSSDTPALFLMKQNVAFLQVNEDLARPEVEEGYYRNSFVMNPGPRP